MPKMELDEPLIQKLEQDEIVSPTNPKRKKSRDTKRVGFSEVPQVQIKASTQEENAILEDGKSNSLNSSDQNSGNSSKNVRETEGEIDDIKEKDERIESINTTPAHLNTIGVANPQTEEDVETDSQFFARKEKEQA